MVPKDTMIASGDCGCPEQNRFGAKHVPGYGRANPRIMAIGEAPGYEEDLQGRPFVGPTGNILHTWMRQAGVLEEEVYFDNVIQHRPPDNQIELADLAAAVPGLFRRILDVNPRLILLLGNTPLHVFIEGNISMWRGAYFPATIGGKTFPCVAAFHPSFIYRQRVRRGSDKERIVDMWGTTVADVRKAWRCSAESGYHVSPQYYSLEPSEEEVEHTLLHTINCETDLVAADIENEPSGFIDIIGYSYGDGKVIVVPSTDKNVATQIRFWRKQPRLVWQNSPYDVVKIRRDWNVFVPDPEWDTLLMHYLLYNYLPHSLAFLGSVYCTIPFWKDQIDINRRKYNAIDVDITRKCCLRMIDELRFTGQYDLARRRHRTLAAVLRMIKTSPTIDVEKMQQLYLTKVAEASAVDKELEQLTGVKYFNPRSPKQVSEWLYKTQKVPVRYVRDATTHQNRPTTNDDALIDIYRVQPQSVVGIVCKTVLKGRRATKLASGYYSLKVNEENRVCGNRGYGPDWKMWGTDSTRYSCKDPALQTFPPRARRIIVAPPGWKLAYADLKQIEYRAMAYCSKDPLMNKIISSGQDVHKMTAVAVTGKPFEEITSWDRFLAKFVNFGIPYGRGPESLADAFYEKFLKEGMSPDEARRAAMIAAQDFYKDYYKNHWTLIQWFEANIAFAHEHKYIQDPSGSRRWFLGIEKPDEEARQIRSTIPQMVAHGIIMDAHAQMYDEGLLEYCNVVLDLHDALLFELDPSEELLGRIKAIMETERLPGFRTPVDVKVGTNWGELDDRVKPGDEDD